MEAFNADFQAVKERFYRIADTAAKKENAHFLWPDLLKIFSVYAVILIHSAAPLLTRYNELGESYWWIGNIYDAFARWCIPLFIMLSGAFIIDRAYEDYRRFFRRRARRVFVPFLVWSGIYFIWRIHFNHEALPLRSFFTLIHTPVYYHLWFLYLIMGLYLLAPVISVYLRNAPRKNLHYFLFFWFIFGSILPVAESFFEFDMFLSGGASNSLFKLSGYFVIGFLLRNTVLDRVRILLCIVLFILSFALTAYGTYHLTVVRKGGIFDGIFYEYFSFNVLFMALPVYLIGKSINPPPYLQAVENRYGFIRMTAACVPGIYLVHAMILAALKRGSWGFILNETTFHPVIGIPFFALVIFLISFLMVILLRRLPGIRFVV